METPTPFEIELVRHVLDAKKDTYPALHAQIPLLRVRSRDVTGVGCYVNFTLPADYVVPEDQRRDAVLGSDKYVAVEDVPNGLSFALTVSSGRVDFLEVVINGDGRWDGVYRNPQVVGAD